MKLIFDFLLVHSNKIDYLHVAVTVAVEPAHPVGTVYERLGSLSQVILLDPLVSSINLYSKEVPTGIVTTTYQRLLDDVY